MKQLGNLATAVASHEDCLLQIFNGEAVVCTGSGNERKTMSCGVWDDKKISEIVQYINFSTK